MRSQIPGIIAMAIIVVVSNIAVQFHYGYYLTYGAFTYPLAFLVNDIVNRVYGAAAARRVVWAGFVTGLVCSLIGTQIIGEYGPIVTLRVALASGVAFLFSQLFDVFLFDRYRTQNWWRAPIIGTLAGTVVDTALFFFIAFSATLVFIEPANDVAWAAEMVPLLGTGPLLPFWASLATADLIVKIVIAFVALLPFRIIVRRMTAGIVH